MYALLLIDRFGLVSSGAGTNLKVGGGAPVRRRKKSLVVPPPLFGSNGTIRRFGERFRDGQYSLVSFLFAVLLLTVLPRAQPFVKVRGGGTRPLCPMESAPLLVSLNTCCL